MSRLRNLVAVAVFLMSLLGCSAAREGGRQAAAGAFEEAESWWAEKKPAIIAAAKEEAATVAEKVTARVEAHVEARAAEAREKQARGEPLSQEDTIYLWLAIAAPFLASLAKAGLRYARGVSDPSPTAPPSARP